MLDYKNAALNKYAAIHNCQHFPNSTESTNSQTPTTQLKMLILFVVLACNDMCNFNLSMYIKDHVINFSHILQSCKINTLVVSSAVYVPARCSTETYFNIDRIIFSC